MTLTYEMYTETPLGNVDPRLSTLFLEKGERACDRACSWVSCRAIDIVALKKCLLRVLPPCRKLRQHVARSRQEFNFVQHVAATCNTRVVIRGL